MSIDELCLCHDFCAPWTLVLGECLQAAGCGCDHVAPTMADTEQAHHQEAVP